MKTAVAWYQQHSHKAALDFISELDGQDDPGRARALAKRREQHAAISALALPFHGNLFRARIENHLWAVAHGSRRPEYWTRRL